mmetsp:Transcript_72796/g.205891  ORF Transcript_72796/g.205891 Transcript_72796/m.205891 type:complete len:86 (-) Transcript_72796:155-412(-)
MIVLCCRYCCKRSTGKVSSHDGRPSPPYYRLRTADTLQFVPLENDKQKDTYAVVGSMTRLDLLLAMTVAMAVHKLAAHQDPTNDP